MANGTMLEVSRIKKGLGFFEQGRRAESSGDARTGWCCRAHEECLPAESSKHHHLTTAQNVMGNFKCRSLALYLQESQWSNVEHMAWRDPFSVLVLPNGVLDLSL
jgi:hypothetical protein